MVTAKQKENLIPAKKGEARNPSGVSSKIQRGSNLFKESLFSYFENNKEIFEQAMKDHPIDAMKVLASICTKDDSDKEPIKIILEIKQVP